MWGGGDQAWGQRAAAAALLMGPIKEEEGRLNKVLCFVNLSC